VLSAVLAGTGLLGGSAALAIAAVTVAVVLFVALRFGRAVEAFIDSPSQEVLLLKVLGLTVLVAGVAQRLQVSAAVGAFLSASHCPGRSPTLRASCSPLCGIYSPLYSSSSSAYKPTRPPCPPSPASLSCWPSRASPPNTPPDGWPPAAPASAAPGEHAPAPH